MPNIGCSGTAACLVTTLMVGSVFYAPGQGCHHRRGQLFFYVKVCRLPVWQGTWAEPLTPTKLSMLTQHRRAQTRKAANCNKAQPIRGSNQQGSASSRALAIAAGSLPSAARAANGFKSKRWGVINRFHIWVSAHASGGGRGRLASKHDVARYRQHMQDSAARTKYNALARIAALARQGNASKRRRSREDPLASELRRRRQNTKRAGLPWHPKAQREALREERRSAHSQEWHRRRACAHKAKSDAKSIHAAELDTLRAFATDSRVHGPISVFSPELQRCLLPFPASGGSAAFWWLPDICTSTWQELAKSMKHAAAEIEQQWQVSHATLTAQGVPKIRPASEAERKARGCWEAGRCMCKEHMGHLRALKGRLDRLLVNFMGPGSRKAGVSPNRRALEDGMVILRLLPRLLPGLGAAGRWFPIPLMALDPLRPTFLKLDADHDQGTVRISPAFSTQRGHPVWLTAWDAIESLDIESAWFAEFWILVATQGPLGSLGPAAAPRSIEATRLSQQELVKLWAGASNEKVAPVTVVDSGSSSAESDGAESIVSRPCKRRRKEAEAEATISAVAVPVPADPGPSNPTGDVALVARIRSTKGVEQFVQASNGSNLKMLLTWRKPGKGCTFGGVQATCYQHEAQRCTNQTCM